MNINFLQKRVLQASKFEKSDKKIFNYTLIYFAIASVITIAMVGSEIFFNSQVKKIKNQQDLLKNSILKNEDLEFKFLVFSNKLSLIKEIFEKRSDKQAAINYFTDLFPEGIYISGIDYDETQQTLNMKVTSEDVFLFETATQILDSDDVKSNFANVGKDNLRRDDTGKYNMNLNIGLLNQSELEALQAKANNEETE